MGQNQHCWNKNVIIIGWSGQIMYSSAPFSGPQHLARHSYVDTASGVKICFTWYVVCLKTFIFSSCWDPCDSSCMTHWCWGECVEKVLCYWWGRECVKLHVISLSAVVNFTCVVLLKIADCTRNSVYDITVFQNWITHEKLLEINGLLDWNRSFVDLPL